MEGGGAGGGPAAPTSVPSGVRIQTVVRKEWDTKKPRSIGLAREG